MELYIVRHGESLSNIGESNDSDSKLSPKGERQAECLGQYLKDIKFDRIYTSHLCRAAQTAVAVAKYQRGNPEIIVAPEFSETNTSKDYEVNAEFLGQLYGNLSYTRASIENDCGDDVERLEAAIDKYVNTPAYSNAAVTGEWCGRPKKYNPQKILIVSHGGAIAVMLRYIANFNPDTNLDVVQHNTCINKFELFLLDGMAHRRFLRYNDVTHLPDGLRLETQF